VSGHETSVQERPAPDAVRLTDRPATIEIAFLDVGQGDTAVISAYDPTRDAQAALVVDCVDPVAVLRYLKARRIQRISGLVLTHLHQDHCKGVVELLKQYADWAGVPCGTVFYNWSPMSVSQADRRKLVRDNDAHDEADAGHPTERETVLKTFLAWVSANGTRVASIEQSGRPCILPAPFCDAVQVRQPWHSDMPALLSKGLNNTSVLLRVQAPGGATALLTGDLEPHAWELLKRHDGFDARADVLKFPHHGAWDDSQAAVAELLNAVDPSLVVISVGSEGVKYDHPKSHVFAELRARKDRVRFFCTQATAKCGDVSEQTAAEARRRLRLHGEPLTGDARPTAVRGCSCAGTVVIELDETATVVQPQLRFHRDEVVRVLYARHQCPLHDGGPVPAHH
jgi:competence protein ComEC